MKQYPSIDGRIVDLPIFAFAKYDGSQIRCEWDRKNGLHKFGSRKVLVGEDHAFLGQAQSLVLTKYDGLNKVFRDRQFVKTTLFFEFYGPGSFAGVHIHDEEHTVTLFDVDVYKKGLLPPREFLDLWKKTDVEHAELLYSGNPNSDFVKSVKDGTLPGMPFEGVVCKGPPLKRGFLPMMFKLKSMAWIQKVKSLYGNDPMALADLL